MSAPVAVEPRPGERLMPLDGVRGLAVLIVVIHYSVWIAETSQLLLMKLTSSILATGWVGVQLFFVLSGFLITGILLDAKGKARYFSSFYFRRMLRIFPRYCIVVALILVVAPRLAWNEAWADAVRQGHRWAHWFYVQNWITSSPGFDALSHTWSLAVEEQFYLVWPLVVWLLGRRGLTWLCGFAMAGTPCISLALRQSGWDPNTAYEFTIARWDALAAGALVAILVRDDAGRGMLHR